VGSEERDGEWELEDEEGEMAIEDLDLLRLRAIVDVSA
jgi:hypothetical protein